MSGPLYYTASKNNIGIRPYNSTDAKAMHEAVEASIEHLLNYLPCFQNHSLPEIQGIVDACIEVWKKNEQFFFVIYQVDDGRFLGSVSVDHIDWPNRFANIGYWVRKDATCKGVATIATELAAQFAFQKLYANRIELIIEVTNVASQKVALKVGCKQDAVLQDRIVNHNRANDAIMYSLLARDFNKI
ncbi:MAG: GNAT family protein [Gammaproteobacteria bacterium]